MNLSVLICHIPERQASLNELIGVLQKQTEPFQKSQISTSEVIIDRYFNAIMEILVCADKPGRSRRNIRVGHKRNLLIKYASAMYFSFVDDDDMVSDDYVKEIFAGIKDLPDCVVFDLVMTENGAHKFDVRYDHKYNRDWNEPGKAYRMPNHIMVWRRQLVQGVRFPQISFGEDGVWARTVRHRIKRQHRIEKVLYFYRYDTEKTATQKNIRFR